MAESCFGHRDSRSVGRRGVVVLLFCFGDWRGTSLGAISGEGGRADKGWGAVRGRRGRVGVGVGWAGVVAGIGYGGRGEGGGTWFGVPCRVGGEGGAVWLKIVSYRYLGGLGFVFRCGGDGDWRRDAEDSVFGGWVVVVSFFGHSLFSRGRTIYSVTTLRLVPQCTFQHRQAGKRSPQFRTCNIQGTCHSLSHSTAMDTLPDIAAGA